MRCQCHCRVPAQGRRILLPFLPVALPSIFITRWPPLPPECPTMWRRTKKKSLPPCVKRCKKSILGFYIWSLLWPPGHSDDPERDWHRVPGAGETLGATAFVHAKEEAGRGGEREAEAHRGRDGEREEEEGGGRATAHTGRAGQKDVSGWPGGGAEEGLFEEVRKLKDVRSLNVTISPPCNISGKQRWRWSESRRKKIEKSEMRRRKFYRFESSSKWHFTVIENLEFLLKMCQGVFLLRQPVTYCWLRISGCAESLMFYVVSHRVQRLLFPSGDSTPL